MAPTTILIIYLSLFTLDFLLDWFLDILNLNASIKSQEKIPPAFVGRVDGKTHKRSVRYTLRRGRFGLTKSLLGRGVVLVVLLSGVAGIFDSLLMSRGLGLFWRGFIFLATLSFALSLIDLPSALYSQFIIEEEFGFNTMKPSLYFADMAKQLILGAILLLALLGGLHAGRVLFEQWWWLAAWVFWTTFQLLLMVIYPVLIAPLFNKFTPLEEGSLKERITALAEKTGFANRGIFVMDGSKRSSHSNAYFTGIGAARRIVLFDTLIKNLKEDELEAVLAHEIGHWKFGHIRTRLLFSIFLSLAGFALMGAALYWEQLFRAFGFAAPSLHTLLFWISFYAGPISLIFAPLSNIWSRKHEFQADRFAAAVCETTESMKNALLSLGRDNLSNLSPHPSYSFWHYSHPALAERLAALETLEEGKESEAAEAQEYSK